MEWLVEGASAVLRHGVVARRVTVRKIVLPTADENAFAPGADSVNGMLDQSVFPPQPNHVNVRVLVHVDGFDPSRDRWVGAEQLLPLPTADEQQGEQDVKSDAGCALQRFAELQKFAATTSGPVPRPMPNAQCLDPCGLPQDHVLLRRLRQTLATQTTRRLKLGLVPNFAAGNTLTAAAVLRRWMGRFESTHKFAEDEPHVPAVHADDVVFFAAAVLVTLERGLPHGLLTAEELAHCLHSLHALGDDDSESQATEEFETESAPPSCGAPFHKYVSPLAQIAPAILLLRVAARLPYTLRFMGRSISTFPPRRPGTLGETDMTFLVSRVARTLLADFVAFLLWPGAGVVRKLVLNESSFQNNNDSADAARVVRVNEATFGHSALFSVHTYAESDEQYRDIYDSDDVLIEQEGMCTHVTRHDMRLAARLQQVLVDTPAPRVLSHVRSAAQQKKDEALRLAREQLRDTFDRLVLIVMQPPGKSGDGTYEDSDKANRKFLRPPRLLAFASLTATNAPPQTPKPQKSRVNLTESLRSRTRSGRKQQQPQQPKRSKTKKSFSSSQKKRSGSRRTSKSVASDAERMVDDDEDGIAC